VSIYSVTLKSTGVTYHLTLAIRSFLNLDYIPVDIRNDCLSVQNVVVDVGNESVGVRSSYVCIYCKLSLGIDRQ